MVAAAASECSLVSGLLTCCGDVGIKLGASGDSTSPGLPLKASSISFFILASLP